MKILDGSVQFFKIKTKLTFGFPHKPRLTMYWCVRVTACNARLWTVWFSFSKTKTATDFLFSAHACKHCSNRTLLKTTSNHAIKFHVYMWFRSVVHMCRFSHLANFFKPANLLHLARFPLFGLFRRPSSGFNRHFSPFIPLISDDWYFSTYDAANYPTAGRLLAHTRRATQMTVCSEDCDCIKSDVTVSDRSTSCNDVSLRTDPVRSSLCTNHRCN